MEFLGLICCVHHIDEKRLNIDILHTLSAET